MTLGKAEEGEIEAQSEIIHSYLLLTAQSLARAEKFSERELYEEIGKKDCLKEGRSGKVERRLFKKEGGLNEEVARFFRMEESDFLLQIIDSII